MAMVFVILAFSNVVAPLLLFKIKSAQHQPLEYWCFSGIILVLLLQKHFKLNIYLMLNLSLALLTTGFVIALVLETYLTAGAICVICFGSSYVISLVNIYYLAGFMAKKFQNITFYKVGIILSAIYYFYRFRAIWIFKNTLPNISIVSVCILIVFFMLSPLFVKLLYKGEWIDDSYR